MTPKTFSAPTARSVAATALARVVFENAFAAAALEAELSRAVQLEPRDRSLTTELTYGTLRVLPWLESRLETYSKKSIRALPPLVHAHILLAAYQIFFMRVPAFAAVNEAVGAVREDKGERMSAFANAVLRKIATSAETVSDAERDGARLASIPEWLRCALVRSVGEEAASALVGISESPPSAIRIERAETRDEWLARFREERPHGHFEPGKISPLAILVRGAGKLETMSGYAEGHWSIQEEGSQIVALAVGTKKSDHVLDACAGRGNKTAILARAVEVEGFVDACDSHPKKLARLRIELERIGLAPRETYAVDWGIGSGDVPREHYDRVLVDAPCSGSGTLRRRPEITLRRGNEDLEAIAALQVAITLRAADHVKVGGRLVYAVCSVLREEAEDVVEKIVAHNSSLEPSPFESSFGVEKDATQMRLLPHLHGTDGYFVASFVKRSAAHPSS